ncbi:substrate-binding periplasmic protein [Chitinimonas sp. PSY-7]|uniref:substrate-binding periplasmic protein n=1 Tax=Chitinimonas sp. PSY-7 TaxID=3459088 RepID=UPI00403FEF9B
MSLNNFYILVAALLLANLNIAWSTPVFMSTVSPWSSEEKIGNPDGINVRITRMLATRSGLDLQPTLVPPARHMAAFKAAEAAYSISLRANLTDENGKVIAHIATYPIQIAIANKTRFTNYEDFVKSSSNGVGILRGLKYPVVSTDDRIIKKELDSVEQGLRMVAHGRIDGFASTGPALQAALQKIPDRQLINQFLTISEAEWVIRSRPGVTEGDIRKITTAIENMRKEGLIEKIAKDYITESRDNHEMRDK